MSTYTALVALWLWSRRLPLTPRMRFGMNAMLGVGTAQVCYHFVFSIHPWIQVALGISTLLWLVPVPLASAHQGGSLTLLSCAIWMMHIVRRLPK